MLDSWPILVPLISPFTDDGAQLSEVRLSRAIRWHMDKGASGFLVGGDTGEWWSLAFAERKQLVEWVMREVRTLPVYVHATANTTAAILDLCQTAGKYGAAGAVVTPPALSLTEPEMQALGMALRRYGGLPTAYLDPTGTYTLEGTGLVFKNISKEGLSGLAFNRSAQVEEAVVGSSVITPLALFGAENARKMALEWPKWKFRVQTLFKTARGPRLAKCLMQEVYKDLGMPRAPLQSLDDQSRTMLQSILADLG